MNIYHLYGGSYTTTSSRRNYSVLSYLMPLSFLLFFSSLPRCIVKREEKIEFRQYIQEKQKREYNMTQDISPEGIEKLLDYMERTSKPFFVYVEVASNVVKIGSPDSFLEPKDVGEITPDSMILPEEKDGVKVELKEGDKLVGWTSAEKFKLPEGMTLTVPMPDKIPFFRKVTSVVNLPGGIQKVFTAPASISDVFDVLMIVGGEMVLTSGKENFEIEDLIPDSDINAPEEIVGQRIGGGVAQRNLSPRISSKRKDKQDNFDKWADMTMNFDVDWNQYARTVLGKPIEIGAGKRKERTPVYREIKASFTVPFDEPNSPLSVNFSALYFVKYSIDTYFINLGTFLDRLRKEATACPLGVPWPFSSPVPFDKEGGGKKKSALTNTDPPVSVTPRDILNDTSKWRRVVKETENCCLFTLVPEYEISNDLDGTKLAPINVYCALFDFTLRPVGIVVPRLPDIGKIIQILGDMPILLPEIMAENTIFFGQVGAFAAAGAYIKYDGGDSCVSDMSIEGELTKTFRYQSAMTFQLTPQYAISPGDKVHPYSRSHVQENDYFTALNKLSPAYSTYKDGDGRIIYSAPPQFSNSPFLGQFNLNLNISLEDIICQVKLEITKPIRATFTLCDGLEISGDSMSICEFAFSQNVEATNTESKVTRFLKRICTDYYSFLFRVKISDIIRSINFSDILKSFNVPQFGRLRLDGINICDPLNKVVRNLSGTPNVNVCEGIGKNEIPTLSDLLREVKLCNFIPSAPCTKSLGEIMESIDISQINIPGFGKLGDVFNKIANMRMPRFKLAKITDTDNKLIHTSSKTFTLLGFIPVVLRLDVKEKHRLNVEAMGKPIEGLWAIAGAHAGGGLVGAKAAESVSTLLKKIKKKANEPEILDPIRDPSNALEILDALSRCDEWTNFLKARFVRLLGLSTDEVRGIKEAYFEEKLISLAGILSVHKLPSYDYINIFHSAFNSFYDECDIGNGKDDDETAVLVFGKDSGFKQCGGVKDINSGALIGGVICGGVKGGVIKREGILRFYDSFVQFDIIPSVSIAVDIADFVVPLVGGITIKLQAEGDAVAPIQFRFELNRIDRGIEKKKGKNYLGAPLYLSSIDIPDPMRYCGTELNGFFTSDITISARGMARIGPIPLGAELGPWSFNLFSYDIFEVIPPEMEKYLEENKIYKVGDCISGRPGDCSLVGYYQCYEFCDGLDNDMDGKVDNNLGETLAFLVAIQDECPMIAGLSKYLGGYEVFRDSDGDGFGDSSGAPSVKCTWLSPPSKFPPTGFSYNNYDCNDKNSEVNPSAEEVCNLIDDDCNGIKDESFDFVRLYRDADGDGVGVNASQCKRVLISSKDELKKYQKLICVEMCADAVPPSFPGGWTIITGDCDDSDCNVSPLVAEDDPCDSTDSNCDGSTTLNRVCIITEKGSFVCEKNENSQVSSDACAKFQGFEINGGNTESAGYISNSDIILAPNIKRNGEKKDKKDNKDKEHVDSQFGKVISDFIKKLLMFLRRGGDKLSSLVFPHAVAQELLLDASQCITPKVYCVDKDGDGYQGPERAFGYAKISGYTECNNKKSDCDDSDKDVYPGKDEVIDRKDNNCDGVVDNIYPTSLTVGCITSNSVQLMWKEDIPNEENFVVLSMKLFAVYKMEKRDKVKDVAETYYKKLKDELKNDNVGIIDLGGNTEGNTYFTISGVGTAPPSPSSYKAPALLKDIVNTEEDLLLTDSLKMDFSQYKTLQVKFKSLPDAFREIAQGAKGYDFFPLPATRGIPAQFDAVSCDYRNEIFSDIGKSGIVIAKKGDFFYVFEVRREFNFGANETSGELKNFIPGEIYSFTVYAKNSTGESDCSNLVSVKIPGVFFENAEKVEVGAIHSCVLRSDGNLFCFGDDSEGQLGDCDTVSGKWEPARALSDVISFSLGGINTSESGSTYITREVGHTCAVTENGELYCWGTNRDGQVGVSSSQNYVTSPVFITDEVKMVSAGGKHTCILKQDKSLWCWGDNSSKQISSNPDLNSSLKSPFNVKFSDAGVETFSDVSAGGNFTCASSEGRVICWGDNSLGQLGTFSKTYGPVDINLSDVVDVEAGLYHACALRSGGDLYCWGWNYWGQVGVGLSSESVRTPAFVMSDVKKVSLGFFHTCALKNTGEVLCWGWNYWGQLGDVESNIFSNVPRPVSVSQKVRDVSAGGNHTCVITEGKNVLCWGYNIAGQIGRLTQIRESFPVNVTAGEGNKYCYAKQYEDTRAITWCVDLDGDSYYGTVVSSCAQPFPNAKLGNTQCNADCDDRDKNINPSASEVCDDIDNDCDGSIDEELTNYTYYKDLDGDGWGDSSNSVQTCEASPPAGFVSNSGDCNDENKDVNPSADEVCDFIDNDCDGTADNGLTIYVFYEDKDADGYGAPLWGSMDNPTTLSALPSNLPSGVTVSCLNSAPEGFTTTATDCDDTDVAVNPGAEPDCTNSKDSDCDGNIEQYFWRDQDSDGFTTSCKICGNQMPAGYTSQQNGWDCNDLNPNIGICYARTFESFAEMNPKKFFSFGDMGFIVGETNGDFNVSVHLITLGQDGSAKGIYSVSITHPSPGDGLKIYLRDVTVEYSGTSLPSEITFVALLSIANQAFFLVRFPFDMNTESLSSGLITLVNTDHSLDASECIFRRIKYIGDGIHLYKVFGRNCIAYVDYSYASTVDIITESTLTYDISEIYDVESPNSSSYFFLASATYGGFAFPTTLMVVGNSCLCLDIECFSRQCPSTLISHTNFILKDVYVSRDNISIGVIPKLDPTQADISPIFINVGNWDPSSFQIAWNFIINNKFSSFTEMMLYKSGSIKHYIFGFASASGIYTVGVTESGGQPNFSWGYTFKYGNGISYVVPMNDKDFVFLSRDENGKAYLVRSPFETGANICNTTEFSISFSSEIIQVAGINIVLSILNAPLISSISYVEPEVENITENLLCPLENVCL